MDFIAQIKEILYTPRKFFEKKQVDLKSTFVFLAKIAFIASILSAIAVYYIDNAFAEWVLHLLGVEAQLPDVSTDTITWTPFIGYLATLIGSFISAGVLHLWLRICGAHQSYKAAYHLSVYSSIPVMLLGWLPIISLAAEIWRIVLMVIGVQEHTHFSRKKSIIVVVVPAVVLTLFFIAVFVGALMFG